MSQSSVLIVEDDVSLREALNDTLLLAGYQVFAAANGDEALSIIDCEAVQLVVSDVQMKPMDGHLLLKNIKKIRPELPVVLMTAYGSISQAVGALQDGAMDYLVKPFEAKVLVDMVRKFILHEVMEDGGMIAVDERSKAVKCLAERVANSDATVMITGESGVGKEVLAHHIHLHSSRAKNPFIAINCAAIPENMLESTLFGYEKGAYTGAYNSCPGKFEQAEGGTLLLDEISEMDIGLQAKLLRVLQEREVERLGGRKIIPLNIRVLATTNRNLKEEVNEGRFREDLFYRLNVIMLEMPPLRDRPGDILPLVSNMIQRAATKSGGNVELTSAASNKLMAYQWPGNVRELDNVIQRALILRSGNVIDTSDLMMDSGMMGLMMPSKDKIESPSLMDAEVSSQKGVDLKAHEHRLILEILESVKGSRKKTAEKLGISQRTLRYKLVKMREGGITIPPSVAHA